MIVCFSVRKHGVSRGKDGDLRVHFDRAARQRFVDTIDTAAEGVEFGRQ